MSKFVSFTRLQSAINELPAWREQVNTQGAVHLWQFLALRRSEVNTTEWVKHEEAADEAFWDSMMKVREGSEPYFDPVSKSFRIATHWHSNVATARKNTFKNRWQAVEVNPGDKDQWKLTPKYLDILVEKAWTRAGSVTRVPVHALCAWLYRQTEFPDSYTLGEVRDRLRSDFHLTDAEYGRLFQETTLEGDKESEETFFSAETPSADKIRMALEALPGVQGRATETKPKKDLSVPVSADDSISPEQVASLLVDGRGQVVLFGPPGTGKTFVAKAAIAQILDVPYESLKDYQLDPATLHVTAPDAAKKGAWSIVQFHPSYVYEDFIRGISGTVGEGGMPTFAVKDRVFAKMCAYVAQTDGFVVLVIDEINRGDLAKVLGELVYALEYRGETVALQYAASDGSSSFVVPRRLMVVATMNTADKSVAHLDYAIRRRFDFVHCAPDRKVVEKYHASTGLQQKALKLFDAVSEVVGSNRDYAVGHAFFLHQQAEAMARAVTFQVLPLLAEYRVEGLIEVDAISLPGWTGGTISLTPARPFLFADELAAWMADGGGNGA